MQAHKQRIFVGAWIAGVLAVVVPLALSLYLSHRWGDERVTAELRQLDTDLLRRVRASREQSQAIFEALKAEPGGPACGPAQLARMRVLAAKASYLQAVGRIEDEVLTCSTLGLETAIRLGIPSRVDADGTAWWNTVEFPQIPGAKFNVAEREGYAAIASPDLVIDILKPDSVISLAQISTRDHEIIRSRGTILPEWFARFEGEPILFEDDEYLVAIQPSNTGNSAAIAAMKQSDVSQRILQLGLRLVPLYLLGGLLLAGAIYALARQRLSFKADLRYALEHKQFYMVYQPVMELATGRCVGAEALIRWNQSDGQMVSPLVFIPAAEEHGLIQQVTLQVMEMVARDAADLIRDYPETHIAINFSAEDLHSPETEARLQTLLKDAGAASSNILIEATERGLMTPEKAKAVLISVRSSGFKVAIDDFGTGNSSLSYLATYDLDFLKIDKMFVDALGSDAPTARVAFHIIEIARSLGLQMIAEGVETQAQCDILTGAGVQYAQGWLFGKPMPMRSLVEFIGQRHRLADVPPEHVPATTA
ncbi:EAL domain-containing protein [Xylophilus rhododendri]|uniref:cyclic-guanylate-specific phosphodiesterase n=1 Tax=Xylophilus rhododendri TaxID=2697032 RepID=A0A857J4W5_9BURK|nr:EAL domain-containing protein [Xylophilus rhododendri]QHI98253.1 EAL domain-containing protein [Xylophilus rhododendri]